MSARGHGGPRTEVAGRSALLAGFGVVAFPLTVRLEADTGACWTSTFAARDVVTPGGTHLRASTR